MRNRLLLLFLSLIVLVSCGSQNEIYFKKSTNDLKFLNSITDFELNYSKKKFGLNVYAVQLDTLEPKIDKVKIYSPTTVFTMQEKSQMDEFTCIPYSYVIVNNKLFYWLDECQRYKKDELEFMVSRGIINFDSEQLVEGLLNPTKSDDMAEVVSYSYIRNSYAWYEVYLENWKGNKLLRRR